MVDETNISEYLDRTGRTAKVYLKQKLSCEANPEVVYTLYTMVGAEQKLTLADIDDLVLIPSTNEVIFNVSPADNNGKKNLTEVIGIVLTDIKRYTKVSHPAYTSVPIWNYRKHIHELV